jgi:hypothetical protein
MNALRETGNVLDIIPDESGRKLKNIILQYLCDRCIYERTKVSGEEKQFHAR